MSGEEICAIIVLYQCRPADSVTLQSLNQAAEVAELSLPVYVYDNSPEPPHWTGFSRLRLAGYHHNPANPGVSAAYNHFAIQSRHEWLLLLDQDTSFPTDFFQELKGFDASDDRLILPQLFQGKQLISPHRFSYGYSYSVAELSPGGHRLDKYSALNSGILIRRTLFEEVGGYPTEVCLYFSDQVFMHKLKEHGLSHFRLLRASCEHAMASNDSSDPAAFRQRFLLFVDGARRALPHFPVLTRLGLRALVLLRGLKLSLRHKQGFYLQRARAILHK